MMHSWIRIPQQPLGVIQKGRKTGCDLPENCQNKIAFESPTLALNAISGPTFTWEKWQRKGISINFSANNFVLSIVATGGDGYFHGKISYPYAPSLVTSYYFQKQRSKYWVLGICLVHAWWILRLVKSRHGWDYSWPQKQLQDSVLISSIHHNNTTTS